MWEEGHRCPTCGAPLPVKNRFVRVITCDFCTNVSVLMDEGIQASGRVASLTPIASQFYLDARGTFDRRSFSVIGRLRYGFGSGVWDEWFLSFDDGDSGWLQEDQGTYTYFERAIITDHAPQFRHLRSGQRITLGEMHMTVIEKGTAEILGTEGQIGFPVIPGETILYVDGTCGHEKLSLEYAADEVELSIGYDVARDKIQVDEAPWS